MVAGTVRANRFRIAGNPDTTHRPCSPIASPIMLDRAPPPFDDNIDTPDGRGWRDPEIPDLIEVLPGWHLATPAEGNPAIVAGGEAVTYGKLANLVDRYAGTLAASSLRPNSVCR